jgi:hypothetical protein
VRWLALATCTVLASPADARGRGDAPADATDVGDCYTSAAQLFAPNVTAKVVITRDSAGTITCRVNDAPQFMFSDGMNVGAFDTAQQTVNFFVDDAVTNGNEASPGVVRRIRIFDAPI